MANKRLTTPGPASSDVWAERAIDYLQVIYVLGIAFSHLRRLEGLPFTELEDLGRSLIQYAEDRGIHDGGKLPPTPF